MRALKIVVVAGLMWAALLVPTVGGAPGDSFTFQPTLDRQLALTSNPLRVCSSEPNEDMSIGHDPPDGPMVSLNTDTEACVYFANLTDGEHTFNYTQDEGITGTMNHTATIVVTDRIDQVINGELALDGFQSFDVRVTEFLLIGLTILAFANGWIMAGAFAWVAAIGTQVTTPGPLTYTLGYAGFALFIGLEVVGHKFGPIRRVRRFVGDRD